MGTTPASRILGISCFNADAAVAAIEDGRIVFAIRESRLSRHEHDRSLPIHGIEKALQVTGWRAEDVDRAMCTEHHLSHAASAFYTSPFERALVVTVDGAREPESAAIFAGEGNELRKLRSSRFHDSLGLFNAVFTQYLGYAADEGECAVMDLAPYGEPRFYDFIANEVLRFDAEGAFRLNLEFFDFDGADRQYTDRLVDKLGIPPRAPNSPMTGAHQDLAASVQRALEDGVLSLVRAGLKDYPTRDVCLAGGVALNSTANARVIRELGVRLHVHPAAGGAGAALGAALLEAAKQQSGLYRPAFTPYLGLQYTDAQIAAAVTGRNLRHERVADAPSAIAQRLAEGDVVAVVHGRDEWGPRALGCRSILADPRLGPMRDHVNARIKFRERFRPVPAVVLEERYADYFETLGMRSSPHGLFTHEALRPERTAAVVHVDSTSRVQTVNAGQNRYLYEIVKAFDALTGVPVLVNTSFNLRGEPTVSSPEDAVKAFLASGIDCLALEDCIVTGVA